MTPLGPVELVPIGEGRAFGVGGRAIAVFRTRDGRAFATDAACPHRGGSLADGLVGDASVICPLHARRFDLTSGACKSGDCKPLRTYPIVIRDGFLLLEGELR